MHGAELTGVVFMKSRLTVVSRAAKESRIYAQNHKNLITVRIYTHNNGACIHPYQTTVLPHQFSLVIDLYKITTGSINLKLYIKQFSANSENHMTTPVVWQSIIFSTNPH